MTADLEQRFISKFSPTVFVSVLNQSVGLHKTILTEVKSVVGDLLDAVSEAELKLTIVVNLDTDDVDKELYVGKADRTLDRKLYRQSLFFNTIKTAVLSFDQKGKPKFTLHSEVGVARTATTFTITDLDAFNLYILLHLLPYIKQRWKDEASSEKAQRMNKMIAEVVMDKIGGLREKQQENNE